MPPSTPPQPSLESPIDPLENDTQLPLGTLAIQNNYYTPQIDLVALGKLRAKDPELAQHYMQVREQEMQHAQEMDHRIITLEEREQDIRIQDAPAARGYANRAQIASIATVVLSFASAAWFGYLEMEGAAITAMSIGAGVVAVNFLGIRNKGQQ